MEEYNINWKEASGIRRSAIRSLLIVYIIFFIVGMTITTIGIIQSELRLIIGYSLFSLFMITLFTIALRSLIFFEKYSVARKIKLFDDFMEITTIKGFTFRIKYSDIGLISNYHGFRYSSRTVEQLPYTLLVCYHEELGKCIELFLDRKAGEMVIKKYRRYCKEKKIKPCPILEGIIESPEIVRQAVGKLMESSFCNRKNIKYDGYEMYGRIPPPPWLEGGNEDGGQIQ